MDPLFATALRLHQSGRINDAEAVYRQVLAADPRHAGATHHLGIIALNRGNAAAAAELIGKSLAADKKNADAHYHLGLAYAALGRFGDVETHNRRAIALKPDHVGAHLNLGNALKALGRSKDAAASYQRAITIAPQTPDAHFNLANVLFERGDNEAAIASYERAIALKPDYLQARHNLATTLLLVERVDDAITHLDKVLAAKPDFADALAARALAAQLKGDVVAGTAFICRALALRKTDDAMQIFCECLRALKGAPAIANLRPLLIEALSEPWDRPRNLAFAATQVLRVDGPVGALLRRFEKPAAAPPLAAADIAILAADPLLHAVLENTPVAGVDLEAMLTAARRGLVAAAARDDQAFPLDFACALARQCHVNEYVFDLTDEDDFSAGQTRGRLASALATGTQPAPLLVAAAASVGPLHNVKDAGRLTQWTWPEPVETLLTQQLREPAAIDDLRASMPTLTAIDDAVSQKVREQYEDNPYPRWVKMPRAGRTRSIDAFLRKTYPRAALREIKTAGPDMLVAGCGTGQFANEFAQFIDGVRITAIDLSLASLAYAKHRATALGLSNIEFAQADIMALPQTGRTFDIIESSGVLHHMDDPFAAWRGLAGMLRPGGVMRLGFYSERGRADVVAARELIVQGAYTADAEGIRRARRTIARLPANAPAAPITERSDFYALSDCRDLIFHVQEHRVGLPEIKAFIEAQALTFIGFYFAAPQIAARYAARFPGDPAMTDLANWDAFEQDNPQAFAGMYQFWVQKAG